MGPQRLVPQERDWSFATTSFLLFTVSLVAFRRALKVNLGSAAGFLLQACAGALGAIHSCSGEAAPLLARSQREAGWLAAVLGLPLVSFGFHWTNRDLLAANSVVAGGILAAACSDPLASGGQGPAVRAAVAAALLSVLTVSLFTANAWGVAGSLVTLLSVTATELWPAGPSCLRGPCVHSLLLTAGIVALQRALSAQHTAEPA
ncbi:transmembrane protein 276-like [Pristis pectinata]|uniref:transmembrane protein 276-like n=1 Tax=Pristis pectinata TaxID=685728 RepID=UPI00223E6F98|nr:transmembrane protein 276-like [Pristis pectinata]